MVTLAIGGKKTGKKQLKAIFNRQWVNGDFQTYLANIKRRVKAMYGQELKAATADELFDELYDMGLIKTV